jgi:hypothetical protein
MSDITAYAPRLSLLSLTMAVPCRFFGVLLLFLGLMAGACSQTPSRTSPSPDAPPASPGPATIADTSALPALADSLIGLIAQQRWDTLARFVHPELGLRFSPYGYVDSSDVVFAPANVASLDALQEPRTWGRYDGSGKPIRMSFADYYARFVYDRPYREARQGAVNEQVGTGNTINNIPAFFGTKAAFVEYHVPGSEQYSGMDWRSLRLVFLPDEDGRWRLAGLVHGEWTI